MHRKSWGPVLCIVRISTVSLECVKLDFRGRAFKIASFCSWSLISPSFVYVSYHMAELLSCKVSGPWESQLLLSPMSNIFWSSPGVMNKLSINITFDSKYIWNAHNTKLLMCLWTAKRIWFIEKLPKANPKLWMLTFACSLATPALCSCLLWRPLQHPIFLMPFCMFGNGNWCINRQDIHWGHTYNWY